MALLASSEWQEWESRCRETQRRLFPRGPRQVIALEPERRTGKPPLRADDEAALRGEIPGAECRIPTVKRRR